MISYKQYKLLQENLGSYTLGVKAPQGIGVSEAPMLNAMMKKKMHGGVPHGDEDDMKKPPMGDMGDEEEGPPPDMDDTGDDMGDDMGSADDTDIDEPSDDESPEMGDEGEGDMGGDAPPEMGDEAPDMGGEGDAVSPLMKGGPMKKKPLPPSPMMMKKYMKKEEMEPDEEDEEEDEEEMMMKKPSCCAKCSKCKKMKKEENEFLNSLKRQCGTTKFAPDELGYWGPMQEDALIAPTKSEEKNEPAAGEVGYAPTQKVGSVSSFQEWASKYKTKKKK